MFNSDITSLGNELEIHISKIFQVVIKENILINMLHLDQSCIACSVNLNIICIMQSGIVNTAGLRSGQR